MLNGNCLQPNTRSLILANNSGFNALFRSQTLLRFGFEAHGILTESVGQHHIDYILSLVQRLLGTTVDAALDAAHRN